MGRKKRYQVLQKQKVKRRKRREKIKKAGGDPDKYYASGMCVGKPNK